MKKEVKIIVIYSIATVLVIAGFFVFEFCRNASLSNTMKDTLQTYFKNNNTHISSHNFKISNVKIRCEGTNAYVVEFNLSLNDNNSTDFNKMGATIYKDHNTWKVKGFSTGLTAAELKTYNFRCYR